MSGGPTRRRAIARGLDVVCIVALLIALSPWGEPTPEARAVVVLIDLSRSVTDGGRGPLPNGGRIADAVGAFPAAASVSLVAFAGAATVWRADVDPAEAARILRSDPPPAVRDPWATRLDRAAAEAARLLSDRAGRVLLVTDGGGRPDALRALVAAGHRVDVLATPLGPPGAGDLFLAGFDAPLEVVPGEPIRVTATIDGVGAVTRPFTLTAEASSAPGGTVVRTASGRFDGDGAVTVSLRFPTASPGVWTIRARLEEPDGRPDQRDTPADRARVTVRVGAALRLAVWPSAAAPLAGSLNGPLAGPLAGLGRGFDVVADARPEDVDVWVVTDAPRPATADPAWRRAVQTLTAAVEAGAGLLVVGGERTLGPGGWGGTPLEALLPVRCERPGDPVDWTVFVDASGSMAADGRWLRASRAVAALVRSAGDRDRVRVFAFAGETTAVSGWRRIRADDGEDVAASLLASLAAITPRGPTALLPALTAALGADARPAPGEERLRRYVVLSDGALSSPLAACRQMATRLTAAGVRVTAVTTRGDGDAARLEALAGAEGVVLRADPAGLEAAFRGIAADEWWATGPLAVEAAPGGERLGADWPTANRIALTTPRTDRGDLAAVAVTGARRLPAVAIGRAGSGRVAVVTVDYGQRSTGWDRPDPWRAAVTWLAADRVRQPVGTVRVRDGRATVEVAIPPGAPLGGWSLVWGDRRCVLEPVGTTARGGRLRAVVAVPADAPTSARLERAGMPPVPVAVRPAPGAERAAADPTRLARLAAAGGGTVLRRSGSAGLRPGSSRGPAVGGRPWWPWVLVSLLAFLAARGVKSWGVSGR